MGSWKVEEAKRKGKTEYRKQQTYLLVSARQSGSWAAGDEKRNSCARRREALHATTPRPLDLHELLHDVPRVVVLHDPAIPAETKWDGELNAIMREIGGARLTCGVASAIVRGPSAMGYLGEETEAYCSGAEEMGAMETGDRYRGWHDVARGKVTKSWEQGGVGLKNIRDFDVKDEVSILVLGSPKLEIKVISAFSDIPVITWPSSEQSRVFPPLIDFSGHYCHSLAFSDIPAISWLSRTYLSCHYLAFLSGPEYFRHLLSSLSPFQESTCRFREVTWVPLHWVVPTTSPLRALSPLELAKGFVHFFGLIKGFHAIFELWVFLCILVIFLTNWGIYAIFPSRSRGIYAISFLNRGFYTMLHLSWIFRDGVPPVGFLDRRWVPLVGLDQKWGTLGWVFGPEVGCLLWSLDRRWVPPVGVWRGTGGGGPKEPLEEPREERSKGELPWGEASKE
ncbi:hypothetical protein Taro_017544 [Colocasia esculenta]|uniref:Uncharacterized protein n=1 Tax=Colocasia esculenta TaxID=4460 RepID=A0A843URF1_COLES|nr:hypothetical protein [Colocasia esculenta]